MYLLVESNGVATINWNASKGFISGCQQKKDDHLRRDARPIFAAVRRHVCGGLWALRCLHQAQTAVKVWSMLALPPNAQSQQTHTTPSAAQPGVDLRVSIVSPTVSRKCCCFVSWKIDPICPLFGVNQSNEYLFHPSKMAAIIFQHVFGDCSHFLGFGKVECLFCFWFDIRYTCLILQSNMTKQISSILTIVVQKHSFAEEACHSLNAQKMLSQLGGATIVADIVFCIHGHTKIIIGIALQSASIDPYFLNIPRVRVR